MPARGGCRPSGPGTWASGRWPRRGGSVLGCIPCGALDAPARIEEKLTLSARARFGLDTSSVALELLAQLAVMGENVLIYPAERGRPKARRMLTETTGTQDKLIQIFHLDRHAPSVR